MKILITILLALIIIGTPLLATAYINPFAPGGTYNPINVEVEVGKKTENMMIKNNLINTYGLDVFNACYYKCGGSGSPFVESLCLSGLDSCLRYERSRLQYKNTPSNKLSPDEVCKRDYPNSYYKETDPNTGSYVCDCQSGYEWQNKVCIKKQISLDSVCKNDHGQNSYYIGKMTSRNEAICGCLPGYIWRSWEGRSCVIIGEKKPTCKIGIFYTKGVSPTGESRTYGPEEEDEIPCDCPDNYIWQGNMCILKESKPAAEIKPLEVKSEIKNNSVNKNAVVKPVAPVPAQIPAPAQIVLPSSTTSDEIVNIPKDNTDSNTIKEESHALKESVFKPIKTFFGRIFSRLANWFMK